MASTSTPGSARLRYFLQRLPKIQVPRRTAQQEGRFTFFVKLPTELKDRVWHYVAQEERVIELDTAFQISGILQRDHQLPVPPILHVCRDSRAQGKRYYTKCERWRKQDLLNFGCGTTGPARNALWVNFQRDIFLRNWDTSGMISQMGLHFQIKILRMVQHIAFIEYGAEGRPFCNLKKLTSDNLPIYAFPTNSVKDISLYRMDWAVPGKPESVDGDLLRREQLGGMELEKIGDEYYTPWGSDGKKVPPCELPEIPSLALDEHWRPVAQRIKT